MFCWICDLLRLYIDFEFWSISNVFIDIGLFKVIFDPICVEGVMRLAFLKKGMARISLALPRFWLDIFSMYLIAVSASSPIPGRYF